MRILAGWSTRHRPGLLTTDIKNKFRRLVHGFVSSLKGRHLEYMPHSLIDGDPGSCLVADHLFVEILGI